MKNFNQNVLTFIILIGCFLLLGCQSTGFYSNLEKATPYLRSSSAIITSLTLQEAVSEDDRKEKAKIILNIASVIEEMTQNGEVDILVFADKISNSLPNKNHWDEFAASLILIYADFNAQAQSVLDENDRKQVLIQALNKIASGCKLAAQRAL
jgi:hypothetical protein